jgi:hypothetical protein
MWQEVRRFLVVIGHGRLVTNRINALLAAIVEVRELYFSSRFAGSLLDINARIFQDTSPTQTSAW